MIKTNKIDTNMIKTNRIDSNMNVYILILYDDVVNFIVSNFTPLCQN